MKSNFPSIKPEKHYMHQYKYLSNDDVFTGKQILNLLELAKPIVQSIILFNLQETNKPVNRLGEYGTVLDREQK